MAVSVEPAQLAGLPLVGSLLDLRRDLLGTMLRARRDHGDVVRMQAGPPGARVVAYGVFSAAGAQQVLAGDAANFRKENEIYAEIRASFGNGLLTSQDEDYVRQRRLIQPLFTKRRVERYSDAVLDEVTDMVTGWGSGERVVDVAEESTRFALRAVARILFGADVDAAVEAIARCTPGIASYVVRRGYSPVKAPRSWPTPGNLRAAALHHALHEVCDQIIVSRAVAEDAGGEDMLTLLAAASSDEDGEFDAREIRDQVLIFLLAGHETTASSLASTLHCLARHPQIQEQVRAEIDQVLGGIDPGPDVTEALPSLMRVLQESLRLYPAVPMIGRRAVEATEIDGFAIPAGADLIIAPWVIHRHPDYWDRPEEFDPDRFTDVAQEARPRYVWCPFGGGPRACIGQHFSMLETALAVAMILQRYRVEAVDMDVPLSATITLEPQGPMRCRLVPRN